MTFDASFLVEDDKCKSLKLIINPKSVKKMVSKKSFEKIAVLKMTMVNSKWTLTIKYYDKKGKVAIKIALLQIKKL